MCNPVLFRFHLFLFVMFELFDASLDCKNEDGDQNSWSQHTHNHNHPYLYRVEGAATWGVVISIDAASVTAVCAVIIQDCHTGVVAVSNTLDLLARSHFN